MLSEGADNFQRDLPLFILLIYMCFINFISLRFFWKMGGLIFFKLKLRSNRSICPPPLSPVRLLTFFSWENNLSRLTREDLGSAWEPAFRDNHSLRQLTPTLPWHFEDNSFKLRRPVLHGSSKKWRVPVMRDNHLSSVI